MVFVELSVKDYLERLKVLAGQAEKDGKKKVQEFILHLTDADNIDVRIFMIQIMIRIFQYLSIF